MELTHSTTMLLFQKSRLSRCIIRRNFFINCCVSSVQVSVHRPPEKIRIGQVRSLLKEKSVIITRGIRAL